MVNQSYPLLTLLDPNVRGHRMTFLDCLSGFIYHFCVAKVAHNTYRSISIDPYTVIILVVRDRLTPARSPLFLNLSFCLDTSSGFDVDQVIVVDPIEPIRSGGATLKEDRNFVEFHL